MPMTTNDIRQSLLEVIPNSGALQKSIPAVKPSWNKSHRTLRQFRRSRFETVLKKLKLRLKDQMEMIVARKQHSMMPT